MNITNNNKTLIVDNDLFLELLNQGKRLRIKIKGNSMLPFIVGERDMVTLVKASGASLQKGCVVVAQISEKTFFLHRIERVNGNIITLRGDGNPYSRETCEASSILAEAVEILRKGKTYTKGSFAWKTAAFLWPANPLLRRCFLFAWKKFSNFKPTS